MIKILIISTQLKIRIICELTIITSELYIIFNHSVIGLSNSNPINRDYIKFIIISVFALYDILKISAFDVVI